MHCPRLIMAAAGTLALVAFPAEAELRLERVLLSTGGIGYYEYSAEVEGDAILPHGAPGSGRRRAQEPGRVRDEGALGTVSLPGREPLGDVFRELPFDQDAANTPTDLLRALRGAEAEVEGARRLQGHVLSIEREEQQSEDGIETRHRGTLVTDQGLRQFVLEEVDGVRFLDGELDRQVRVALEALAPRLQARAAHAPDPRHRRRHPHPPGRLHRRGPFVAIPICTAAIWPICPAGGSARPAPDRGCGCRGCG